MVVTKAGVVLKPLGPACWNEVGPGISPGLEDSGPEVRQDEWWRIKI